MFVSMYLWIIFDNQSAAPTTIWARNCLLNETKCLGENELVHTHRQESGQILWQWEVRKYYDKGDSVRVNWPKVASSAKAECGRNSDSTRSMFLLLATPSSLPTSLHPPCTPPPPFPLSHPGEGGWIRGVLRASKFLQLMDLCLGISHLGLLQICTHPIMDTN